MPTAYELVSTGVLYSATHEPEVRTPVAGWYARHAAGNALRCDDWEAFFDPRATTFAKYTEEQRRKETFVSGLLRSLQEPDYEASLSRAWLGEQAAFLSAVRFPCHGLQMSSAYIGQLAPSGRIAMASLFQCADELRRVHRIAQCLALLQKTLPAAASSGLALWQSQPSWQPLRQLLEQQLATYGWCEAFVSLNLCLKPEFDALFTSLAIRAREEGDFALAEILGSLGEDSRWHQEWAGALAGILQANSENREKIQQLREKWNPAAKAAMAPLREALVRSIHAPGAAS
jgi:toluene monooxygenase system protein E